MKRCSNTLVKVLAATSALGILVGTAIDHSRAMVAPQAQTSIALQSVVAAGLIQPVFVTSAHDGSGRLFIVEQPGRIKVLQPGSSTPTVFLDISARVLAGGEQGLLGLTFHPQFAANRRFFVDYTRQPDGASVIAEYRVSGTDPNLADHVESVMLTIPQPFANHNGGMVEFGPDGFLYDGKGDGGSGYDPGDRAQNPQELLGKILRIDVDRSANGQPYAIPASNPFANSSAGRPEIYATGLRNPWRFSFDRATGRLIAGDVGQNEVEEIDIVTAGGNYGWRVLEGTSCTGLGPAACSSPGFIPPIAEYTHSLGRCSVTGGYVYRGRRGTLPQGAYVYGDFCSSEIFMLEAGAQSMLLKTSINISSFGEDEDGEIYVVGLGGTIDRIVNPGAPSLPTFYFPLLMSPSSGSAGQDEFTGLAAANLDSQEASLTFTAFDENGSAIQGESIVNPRMLSLRGGEQLARVDTEIFGAGLHAPDRLGWVRLESSTVNLGTLFMAFNTGVSSLDGALAEPLLLSGFILPDIQPPEAWRAFLVNPHADQTQVSLELHSSNGSTRATTSLLLAPNQVAIHTIAALFPGLGVSVDDYVRGIPSQGVAVLEFQEMPGRDARALGALDSTAGSTVLYAPQYAVGGGYQSTLSVTNLESIPASVNFQFFDDAGNPKGTARVLPIAAQGKILVSDAAFFGDLGSSLSQGYVEIRSSGPLLAGCISYSDSTGRSFSTEIPLLSGFERRLVFGHVASNADYYTGMAIVNPSGSTANVHIDVHDQLGITQVSGDFAIPSKGRISSTLTSLFPNLAGRDLTGGYVLITADRGIAACGVFGAYNLTVLSSLPAQVRTVR